MQLDRESCQRARMARDPRFDGCFFTAVKTTRIYCRAAECIAECRRKSLPRPLDWSGLASFSSIALALPTVHCRCDETH